SGRGVFMSESSNPGPGDPSGAAAAPRPAWSENAAAALEMLLAALVDAARHPGDLDAWLLVVVLATSLAAFLRGRRAPPGEKVRTPWAPTRPWAIGMGVLGLAALVVFATH
ncbi:MAG TPA: hypothetical protein VHN99_10215, partial [Deinococcales bacterium]|nr:hypothetical protein [Deinococcales bacterium]